MNISIFLGTLNYENYLRITAAKVSAPTVINFETWVKVPVANYTLQIPNLDSDDYYISFYDSSTSSSQGSLVSQCFVNAVSPEFENEVRFYDIGSLPATAYLDSTSTIIQDSYLVSKTIQSYFKEGFRFLEPTIDLTFDPIIGAITLLQGASFSIGEKFTISIKNAVGAKPVPLMVPGGLYLGTFVGSAENYTLTPSETNKRIRCSRLDGTGRQKFNLPLLSSLNEQDGFYFDNNVGSLCKQASILTQGGDPILYSGWRNTELIGQAFFNEIWVSQGEQMLIRKSSAADGTYYEVVIGNAGWDVGSRITSTFLYQAGYLAENGALYSTHDYGRLWFYITTLLPSTHYIIDDNCINSNYVHPYSQRGMFVISLNNYAFRMPNTQALSEKGLSNFSSYGSDSSNRPYDYPGGTQDQMLLGHTHNVNLGYSGNTVSPYQNASISFPISAKNHDSPIVTASIGGTENRVNNFGVIYMRKI